MDDLFKKLAMVMLKTLGIAGQAAAGDSAVDYVKSGNAKAVKDDLDAAIAHYTRAIGLNSKDTYSYAMCGDVKYDRDDLEGAIAYYTRIIELNPEYGRAYASEPTSSGATPNRPRASWMQPSPTTLAPSNLIRITSTSFRNYREPTLIGAIPSKPREALDALIAGLLLSRRYLSPHTHPVRKPNATRWPLLTYRQIKDGTPGARVKSQARLFPKSDSNHLGGVRQAQSAGITDRLKRLDQIPVRMHGDAMRDEAIDGLDQDPGTDARASAILNEQKKYAFAEKAARKGLAISREDVACQRELDAAVAAQQGK